MRQEIARGEVEIIPVRDNRFERRVVIARPLVKPETALQHAIASLIRELAGEIIERRQ
ncbi:MAG: hypothetical protein JO001_17375 [Alphaproteobacteria bacterium]|nr:hypothetical protein [Alphaproteobacteria bacterium]